jgi:hypothetical protein
MPTLNPSFGTFDLPVPIFSIYGISIFLDFSGTANFKAGGSFGYDSTGLQTGNLADGFYVKDGVTDTSGQPALVLISVGLSANIGAGIPGVVSVSGGGNITADVGLSLQTGADGKYRPSEQGWAIKPVGTLSFGIDVKYNSIFGSGEYDLPVVTQPLF